MRLKIKHMGLILSFTILFSSVGNAFGSINKDIVYAEESLEETEYVNESENEKIEELDEENDEDKDLDKDELDSEDLSIQEIQFYKVDLEEIEKDLDEIEYELLNIEYLVQQWIRTKVSQITTDLNDINDWSTKEPFIERLQNIENDINIKDQLGYIKAQIDAYLSNPNEGLKDRINKDIDNLKDKIKNQEKNGLQEHSEKNNTQLDILDKLLNGDTEGNIEENENRIKELLDSIEERLKNSNTGLVPTSVRMNLKDVESLIRELKDDNSNKVEFQDRLSELKKDTVIKDALYQLEMDINSFEKDPKNESLKSAIERIINLYEETIETQNIDTLKNNNEERLNNLKKRFGKIKDEGKVDEIRTLLKEVSEELFNKSGEPAEISTRQKLNRADLLINLSGNKDELVEYAKDLRFDIAIKDGLEKLEGLVNDYENNSKKRAKEEIKNKIDSQIKEMEEKTKEQEEKGENDYITEHIKHNKDKLARLKKDYGEINKQEIEGNNKQIQIDLDKIKKDLEELKTESVTEEIKQSMKNVSDEIGKLDENNEKLESFKIQYSHLEEDIRIKDELDEIDKFFIKINKDINLKEIINIMDDIEGKISTIKKEIDKQYLTPHKTYNRIRARSMENKSIEMRLKLLKDELFKLKGEKTTEDIKKEHKKIGKMISGIPNGIEIFGDKHKNLSDDIFIKDSLEELNIILDEFIKGNNEINKVDIEHGIEYMDISIKNESEDLKEHKQHNREKLNNIKSKFKDYEIEVANLIEKLLKEIEDELVLQNGEPIIEATGKKMDKTYNLIREMDESDSKNKYYKKFIELYEDAVIKGQLKVLEDDINKYKTNVTEELKKKIEKEIDLLEDRINDENLKPHKSHNRNKLERLKKEYRIIVDSDINKGLSDIIKKLKELIGKPATAGIREERESIKKKIDELDIADINKESYIKKLSYIDEDILLKDEIELISVRVDEYKKTRISDEAIKLEKDIEELKLKIDKQYLTPHKDHNLSRLHEIKDRLKDKTEPEYKGDIDSLLDKVRKELEDLKGEIPSSDTSIPDDFLEIERLIENLSVENRSKYLDDYKELRLDYNNKYRIKDLNDFVKKNLEELNHNLIKEIEQMINATESLIDYQELEPHKIDNKKKLKEIKERLSEAINEKESTDIYKNLKEIEDELFKKNGEKADSDTEEKLKSIIVKINDLPKDNKNKDLLESFANMLSEDIENKELLDKLDGQIKSFNDLTSTGDEYEKKSEEIKKSFEVLYKNIGGQDLLSHKNHNFNKLKNLLDKYQKIIEDKENEDIIEVIEKILKEVEEELKIKKGNSADAITRLKYERVKLLIEQLDSSKNSNKEEYNNKSLQLSNDISIKDDIDLANKFVESYNRTWSDSDKDSMRKFIKSIEERINSQRLVPHKIDNMSRLKTLEKNFEEKIDKENSEIRDLLNKIEKDLRLQEGNKAREETIQDIERVNNLIDNLSNDNKNKVKYREQYNLLEEDKNIKEEIYEINKEVVKYPNGTKNKEIIEKDIGELYEKINKQSLTPHNVHNKNKLDKIKYEFNNKVEEHDKESIAQKIEELLAKIEKDLSDLKGNKATDIINKDIVEAKELLESLKDNSELYSKYDDLVEDRDIKEKLDNLKNRIDGISNNISKKDINKIQEEINKLKDEIKNEGLFPHKDHNLDKLLGLEKTFKDKIKSKPSAPGGSGSTESNDKEKEEELGKEIEKEIENIEKEIEKDEEDKKDIEDIEKDINEVEDKIKELEDGKIKDELSNKLDELKDRLKGQNNIILIDDENHKSYLTGYKDNTIRPNNKTTREEVATVIFRVSDDKKINKYITEEHNFNDVPKGNWSGEAIGTLTNLGVLNGYKDGSFRPKKNLSRGELAKILVKANGMKKSKDTQFEDTKGHWSEEYINALALKGWIKGYQDGTFRPDKNITRAELSSMINNMLGRNRSTEKELTNIKEFMDLDEGSWYYEDILEATIDHKAK